MQKTSKLGLNKPDLTDYVSIADLNENADILDEALGGLQDGSTVIKELQTESKELAGAINELVNKTKLPGGPINTEVTSLKQKLVDLERKIGDLDGLLQEEEKADLVALIQSIKQQLTTHLAERATLNKVGHTQLSSALDSLDETMSATPKAIKKTNDRVDEQALNNKEILRELDYVRINYSNY